MTIKEVYKKTGLSSHVLHFYEKIELIKPITHNSPEHRHYKNSDLELTDFIKKQKSIGMPIKDIIRYITLLDKNEDFYNERIEILKNHRIRIEKQLREIQEFLNIFKFS